MNAIARHIGPAVLPQANLLELRRARMQQRLAEVERSQLASENITVLWRQAAATVEERVAIASLLLADLPFTITPKEAGG